MVTVEISPLHSLTQGGQFSVSVIAWLRKPWGKPQRTGQDFFPLLQLRVLRFGLLQDWDVGVGVFPEGEEILVGSERPDAGGIYSLRGSRLQGIGTRNAQMRQRPRPAVPDDPAVVENLLKLGGGGNPLSGCEVGLSTHIQVIEAGSIGEHANFPQLNGGSRLEGIQGESGILSVQRQLRSNRRQPKRLHLRVQREAFPQVLRQEFGS